MIYRSWATGLLLIGTLSQTLNQCSGYVDTAQDLVNATSTLANASNGPTIDSAQYRELTKSFYPASPADQQHSYPAAQAPTPNDVLEPMQKGDRTIARWQYNVDTGLRLVLLVENDRVIGYTIELGGAE